LRKSLDTIQQHDIDSAEVMGFLLRKPFSLLVVQQN